MIGFSTKCWYTTCMPYKCAIKHYKTSSNNSWFTENTSYSISGCHLNVIPLIWNVDSDYLSNINMYKSHNISKGNTVTIQDKFYICICPGGWIQVIQPLASDHHYIVRYNCFEFGSFSRYCTRKEVCVPL